MLHDDMTFGRIIVYAQLMLDSKHRRIDRRLKRIGASDQEQPRFMNTAQTQEESRSANFKIGKTGCSKNGKPTCVS